MHDPSINQLYIYARDKIRPVNEMANPTQLLVAACLLLPTVFGCSCVYPPEYSTPLESLCRDYQWSSDVFAGRVISASCNCIPPLNDSSYGQADISCVWGNISEYFTSAVIAGATCDTDIQPYGILSCDRVLNRFKLTGRLYCSPYKQHNMYWWYE